MCAITGRMCWGAKEVIIKFVSSNSLFALEAVSKRHARSKMIGFYLFMDGYHHKHLSRFCGCELHQVKSRKIEQQIETVK